MTQCEKSIKAKYENELRMQLEPYEKCLEMSDKSPEKFKAECKTISEEFLDNIMKRSCERNLPDNYDRCKGCTKDAMIHMLAMQKGNEQEGSTFSQKVRECNYIMKKYEEIKSIIDFPIDIIKLAYKRIQGEIKKCEAGSIGNDGELHIEKVLKVFYPDLSQEESRPAEFHHQSLAELYGK